MINKNIRQRVRVIWNPQVSLWYVYNLNEDRPIFTTDRLELHTVGVYGELKTKFAPNGSPSFVGTIASNETVQKGSHHEVISHPNAPSKLLFRGKTVVKFSHSRRILLDGAKMFADTRNLI